MIRETSQRSKILRWIGILAVAVFFEAFGPVKPGNAQEQAAPQQSATSPEIHVLHVQYNVYMLEGDGANITVQVGKDGVLVVDTGETQLADNLLATIRTLSSGPIRYIIDTSDDPDHIGGNETIAMHGSTIAGYNVVGDIGASAGNQAAVISYQTVLDRISAPTGKKAAMPEGAWPTDTFTLGRKDVWFNDEGIRIYHEAAAHTDGDSVVFFRRSDVVSTGDIYRTDSYPVIDLERGGGIQGEIAALNHIVNLAIPAQLETRYGGSEQEGGTLIIPGHGRLTDQSDLVFYQEMVTIIRDRIQDMIKKGMTLEEVESARPTLDYDPLYGRTTGPWTTDMFVDAVYKSLSQKPK